jgi:proteasome lid subunit RPN8/RPN11
VSVLTIPRPILDDMIAHARELDPYECCGLLGGKDGLVTAHYRITNNVAEDARAVNVFNEADVKQLGHLSGPAKAEVAYFMDPKEMLAAFKDMRRQNVDLTVIYHSHTHSPAYPSATDVGLAYYPDAAYVIISLERKDLPEVKAYRIKDGLISPLDFRTSD